MLGLIRIAADYQVEIVDLQKFFESRAKDQIPGRESLVDHVHPSIHSHQLIADEFLKRMQAMQFVTPTDDDWQTERDRRFEAHLENLDFMYYQRGQDRLKGLLRWSSGKVTRERPPSNVPNDDSQTPESSPD